MNHGNCSKLEWMLAHEWYPHTKEVSAAPIDAISADNLHFSIRQGRVGWGSFFLIPYPRFMKDTVRKEWQRATCSFSTEYSCWLEMCHAVMITVLSPNA
jgi:hypothetical protein